MRLFPECGEGMRRLSIVLAVLVFAGLAGEHGRRYQAELSSQQNICESMHASYQVICEHDDRADTGACPQKVDDQVSSCLASMSPSLSQQSQTWSLYILAAIACGYVTALATRSTGWVVNGFRVHA